MRESEQLIARSSCADLSLQYGNLDGVVQVVINDIGIVDFHAHLASHDLIVCGDLELKCPRLGEHSLELAEETSFGFVHVITAQAFHASAYLGNIMEAKTGFACPQRAYRIVARKNLHEVPDGIN